MLATRFADRILHSVARVFGNVFLKKVGMLMSGTIAAQGILILIQPVLTRLYLPEALGQFASAASIAGLLATVVVFRMDGAVLAPADDRKAGAIVKTSLVLICALCAILAILLIVFRSAIADWLGARNLATGLYFLPLCIATIAIALVLGSFMARLRRTRVLMGSGLAQALGIAMGQVLLWLIWPDITGLLLGLVLGSLSQVVLLLHNARPHLRSQNDHRSSEGPGLGVLREYRRFMAAGMPAALLERLSLDLPLLLLAGLHGAQVGGWYGLGYRVITIPAILIGVSASQVFAGEAAALSRRSHAEVYRLFKRIVWLMSAASIPFVLILLAAGPELFAFVFGENWYEAGRYARALSLAMAAMLIASPTGPLLEIYLRQDLHVMRSVVRVGLIIVAYGAALALDLEALGTVWLISAAVALGYIAYVLLSQKSVVDKVSSQAGEYPVRP